MLLLDVNLERSFFLWLNETLCKEVVSSKNYCDLRAWDNKSLHQRAGERDMRQGGE